MRAQEVIIYRNPGEKLVWDFLQSDSMGPVWAILAYACGIAMAVLVGYVTFSILKSFYRDVRRKFRG